MKQMKLWMLAAILTICGMNCARAQVNYVERSWDATNKVVTATTKPLNAGDYTAISSSGEWLSLNDGWYVVTNDVAFTAFNVEGNDVHLVISDGATLTIRHIKVETDHTLSIYGQEHDTGKIFVNTPYYDNAAAIGGGDGASAGTINIHGTYINAKGSTNGAGIGGGKGKGFDGGLNVYGGTISVYGGTDGAGIGSGDSNPSNLAGFINIYGGQISAYGVGGGAGIGGGDSGQGACLHIYGGDIFAEGGDFSAAIGGGKAGNNYQTIIDGGKVKTDGAIGGGAASNVSGKGNGGKIEINGGTVTIEKDRASSGAGIGCGHSGESATIRITGGTVNVVALYDDAAGIGGGGGYNPTLNISITGGTVTTSGRQGIGPGSGMTGEKEYNGTLSITGGKVYATGSYRAIGGANDMTFASSMMTLYPEAMVKAGADADNIERTFSAGERISACVWRNYAAIEPCSHSGATYTVSGTTSTDTHLKHCAYCTTTFEAETHDFEGSSTCKVCGVSGTSYTVTIYYPQTATDGDYTSTTYQMVPNTTFSLPAPPNEPAKLEFAGWLVGTHSNSSFIADSGEELLAEGHEYTITNNVTFTARYRYLDISLADAVDNTETLVKYLGMTANSVTLSGRTLTKNGNWNTLCLPFDVSINDTPLAGDDVVAKVFDNTSSLSADGLLTLKFSAAPATITAGTPFIIKWNNTGVNLVNPVFTGVTISSTAAQEVASTDEKVKFVGQYSPFAITADNINEILYVASGNKIGYAAGARTLKSCRAHFWVKPNGTSATARAINIDWGDGETTSITLVNADSENAASGIYMLDGRKLSDVPTTKGVYIVNGKRIVVK